MRNRKGGVWTIFGIIIGLIIIGVAFKTFYGCTRMSDDALDSFTAFNNKIEYVAEQEKGYIEPVTLQMDEYTGIYGWAAGFDAIKIYARHPYIGSEGLSTVVRRFGTCENRKEACACLCRKFPEKTFTDGVGYISCEQPVCHTFANSTFQTNVEAEGKFIVSRNPNVLHRVEGGFALERHGFGLAYDVMEPRLRAGQIELEKGQGETVGVCIALPCIS